MTTVNVTTDNSQCNYRQQSTLITALSSEITP